MGGFNAPFKGKMRNYRIFREGAALAAFLRWLAGNTEHPRIALVINGDAVDYLADAQPKCFDWQQALEKLKTNIEDPEHKEVWKALQELVAAGHCDLVIVLGNHDLELALPDVQLYLMDLLTDSVAERRGRVLFAMDGSGFSCQVGGRRVLCVHGNEVDPWNAIEYSRLAMIRRALVRGSLERDRRSLAEWIPNPGTQLVIQHLNGLKRRYQWIDLLKPEEEAAAMISAAIADLPSLRTFAEVMGKQKINQKRLEMGFLSGAETVETAEAWASPVGPATRDEVTGMIRDAADSLARGASPVDLVEEPDPEFLLSSGEIARNTLRLKIWPKSLREVLRETLAQDATFEPTTKDSTFRDLDEICGTDIDFIVAGHTHLHRALERERAPGRYYFNSGTWIRLVHIPQEALAPDLFPEVEKRLREGSMEELESPLRSWKGPLSLLKTVRTVVKIASHDEVGALGGLFTFERKGKGWALTPVDGTELPAKAGDR